MRPIFCSRKRRTRASGKGFIAWEQGAMRMRSTNISGRESARLSVSSSRQVDVKRASRRTTLHFPAAFCAWPHPYTRSLPPLPLPPLSPNQSLPEPVSGAHLDPHLFLERFPLSLAIFLKGAAPLDRSLIQMLGRYVCPELCPESVPAARLCQVGSSDSTPDFLKRLQ